MYSLVLETPVVKSVHNIGWFLLRNIKFYEFNLETIKRSK